jgi:hypothetical protein
VARSSRLEGHGAPLSGLSTRNPDENEIVSAPPHLVVDNDTPQRLGVVAAQFGLTAAALRTEAKRGRLVISRVAGKDFTSVAEIREMFERCRVSPRESDSGFARHGEAKKLASSSETAQNRSAQAALNLSLLRLKESSPTTSLASIIPTGQAVRHRRSAS